MNQYEMFTLRSIRQILSEFVFQEDETRVEAEKAGTTNMHHIVGLQKDSMGLADLGTSVEWYLRDEVKDSDGHKTELGRGRLVKIYEFPQVKRILDLN